MRVIMKYNPNSLYYRLNPEHLEYLLSTEPSFPSTIGSVLNEVREKEFWHQLTYETICTLVDFLGKGKGDYSPTFIDSIFNTK
jgi:hypothetical protein